MNQGFYLGSGKLLSAATLLLVAACASKGTGVGTTTGGGGADNNTSGSTGGDSSGTGNSGTPVTGAGGSTDNGGAPATGAGGVNMTSGGMGGMSTTGTACSILTAVTGTGDGGTNLIPTCPEGHGYKGTCHEFFAADNSRNQLNYVNQFTSARPGGVVWTAPVGDTGANSPRTIEIVDDPMAKCGKAVLVSLDKGYAEFDVVDGAKTASVLSQTDPVTGACRLPDGNTALGMSNIIKIVSPTGAMVRQFNIPAGGELRAINRNPADGHFWFARTEYIYEVDDQGTELWKGYMGVGTHGSAVWWREGGGAYAATGEPATIIEMDATGTIVSTVGGEGPMFPFLNFFSSFVRLANGNYVAANWLGHVSNITIEPWLSAPMVLEFAAPCGGALGPCAAPKNEIVWQWECPTCPQKNQTLSRQITNVLVIR